MIQDGTADTDRNTGQIGINEGPLRIIVLNFTEYLTSNVFHHRVRQPTECVKKAWHDHLMLCIFIFIAIK
jgi:hypothetical protein